MQGIDHANLVVGEVGIYIKVDPIPPDAPSIEVSSFIILDVRAPKSYTVSVSARRIRSGSQFASISFQLLPPPTPTYTYGEAPELHGTANVYWSRGRAEYSDNRTQIRGPLAGLDWSLVVKLMHNADGDGHSIQETLTVAIVGGQIRSLVLNGNGQ
jgi:hypothetical protein